MRYSQKLFSNRATFKLAYKFFWFMSRYSSNMLLVALLDRLQKRLIYFVESFCDFFVYFFFIFFPFLWSLNICSITHFVHLTIYDFLFSNQLILYNFKQHRFLFILSFFFFQIIYLYQFYYYLANTGLFSIYH